MATNKHALIRYQTLDKCFRNPGRRYDIYDLVEACCIALKEFSGADKGIQRRQVLYDIKFMESDQGWNIPLERKKDGQKVYFRYTDYQFSINSRPQLNEVEENQIREALFLLTRFKGMPQFEWIDEIITRLDSGLKLSKSNQKIIDFEQNIYLKGLEYFSPLYNAILYQKVLRIDYQSFKSVNSNGIILHPYFLKQYNNRWYIFGKSDSTSNIINLALDRISKIEEYDLEFSPNNQIDFDEFFEDIVGVTRSDEHECEQIILKIDNKLFPYIRTKPIHGSQKIKEYGMTHTCVALNLIPNYELESILLSYGEGIEVLEPQSLRERLANRIRLSMLNYKVSSAE